MAEVNIHGLSRTIPDEIKRKVRQECGFGCVCCGLAIATYEHIDPSFKDATEHDPSKMAYLCGSCHDRVTRGAWSKQRILDARQNPWCIKNQRCHDSFDVSAPDTTIWAGPNEIININKILSIDNNVILAIEQPEQMGEPYAISGDFYDDTGRLLFKIIRNEWLGSIKSWDIETVGRTTTIKKGAGKIALRITALPPSGIIIERADMYFRHTRFTVNEYQASLLTSDGGGVILRGRRIIGYEPATVLLAAYHTGGFAIGGGGLFAIKGPPNNLPDFIRKRTPIGANSKCPCGSCLKYKRCCQTKRSGLPPPGKGPTMTFDGIPLS